MVVAGKPVSLSAPEYKVLYDLGWVATPEPFQKLRHQGMVLSYSYQDRQGAYHAYAEIDFSGPRARLRATGEELKEQVEKMSKLLLPKQDLFNKAHDSMLLN